MNGLRVGVDFSSRFAHGFEGREVESKAANIRRRNLLLNCLFREFQPASNDVNSVVQYPEVRLILPVDIVTSDDDQIGVFGDNARGLESNTVDGSASD